MTIRKKKKRMQSLCFVGHDGPTLISDDYNEKVGGFIYCLLLANHEMN